MRMNEGMGKTEKQNQFPLHLPFSFTEAVHATYQHFCECPAAYTTECLSVLIFKLLAWLLKLYGRVKHGYCLAN